MLLSSSLPPRRILARIIAGRPTTRFKSSSALSRRDLLSSSPEQSPWLSSPTSNPSTSPPLILPSKTTTTPSSSSLSSAQRPHSRLPQSELTSAKPLPPRNTQPPPNQSSGVRVPSSSLLALLRDLARNPSSPPTPSADLVALFAGERSLVVTNTREAPEAEEVARRLMERASSLEAGVDVASWIFRVTEDDQGGNAVKHLVYRSIQELGELLLRIRPRPHPDVLLQFLLSNQPRIRLSFVMNNNPLVTLLEIYSRLYIQDQRRLDSTSAAPPANVLAELESLRLQHVDAVRAIHQAMKEVDKDVFTVRSYTSLMDAYKWGSAYDEVGKIWELMTSGGGVGISQRTVSVYFDACGFSGSLPHALAAFRDLQDSGFALDDNDYNAYHECLIRCGALDEYLVHLAEQQARWLVDPSSAPSVHPGSLVRVFAQGKRVVGYPRHQSLRPVDWNAFDHLKARMQQIVSRETWEETTRLLATKGNWDSRVVTKQGPGRMDRPRSY